MKKIILSCVAALAAFVCAQAQQISVVAPGGATTVYTDLNAAINDATAGSTIYLSGGGFQLSNETKITKKLTIVGIGHKVDNDNADGNTVVSGNFYFEGGSDGSTLMGVYLSGYVNIGSATAVNNFLLRYCNVNGVAVQNGNCQGVVINQNYVRSELNGMNSAMTLSNNITGTILNVTGGCIENNIVFATSYIFSIITIYSSIVKNNILLATANSIHQGTTSNNIWSSTPFGDNSIQITLADEIEGPNNGINTTSNFHFKADSQGKNAGTDGTDIGIYGGTGFSDSALPPGPRIVSKRVAEQTDANGNLRVEITVSAE